MKTDARMKHNKIRKEKANEKWEECQEYIKH